MVNQGVMNPPYQLRQNQLRNLAAFIVWWGNQGRGRGWLKIPRQWRNAYSTRYDEIMRAYNRQGD